MILLLGAPEDVCLLGLAERLRQQRRRALLIPEDHLREAVQIAWELPAISGFIRYNRCSVAFAELSAVLVRLRHSLRANMAEPDDANYIRLEWSALLFGWLKSLPCPVVNRPMLGAGQRFPETHAVATALRQAGFDHPHTLATASRETAQNFVRRHQGLVLCRWLGSAPSRLLTKGSLPAWPASGGLCRLQAIPDGQSLAAFVAGDNVFAAEASVGSLLGLFREPWREARLTVSLSRQCTQLALSLELAFARFLIVRGATGESVLEISDMPDISRCDDSLRTRIIDALARNLTHNGSRPRRSPAKGGP